MRRYTISIELTKPKRALAVADCIRKFAAAWEQPLAGLWLVETSLSAAEIRSALLGAVDFKDRFFISETKGEPVALNARSLSNPKVVPIEGARVRARILSGIFERQGATCRHLKDATSKSLRSA
jgi:hypothetical protein